jgi:cyclic pyranopterin phosphate synthase
MAKGRNGCAGNGAICSRIWKENMFRLAHDASPTPPVGLLRDPQGRTLDYLRLAVTDRCNLRCRYCMPAEGIGLVAKSDVLSLEEMQRLGAVFARLGVRKIRITGGEPLLRKGVVELMAGLSGLPTSPEILLTTNGLLLDRKLEALRQAGVRRINLSLDSLDPENWFRITRRDGHATVLRAMERVVEMGMGLKINMVVLPGRNDHEVPDFVALTRVRDLTVRFIEPMPFDGAGKPLTAISGTEILALIEPRYTLQPLENPVGAVDKLFAVPGYRGRIGIIEGHSRTFCASCRRLRVDARGRLRTCLYGRPQVDLQAMMRDGTTDQELMAAIRGAVGRRLVDGLVAEQDSRSAGTESMASIGG